MNDYFYEYFDTERRLEEYIRFEVEPKNRKFEVRNIRIGGMITGYEIKVYRD